MLPNQQQLYQQRMMAAAQQQQNAQMLLFRQQQMRAMHQQQMQQQQMQQQLSQQQPGSSMMMGAAATRPSKKEPASISNSNKGPIGSTQSNSMHPPRVNRNSTALPTSQNPVFLSLLKQQHPQVQLDIVVEEMLLSLTEDFVEHIMDRSANVAKCSGKEKVEARDVNFIVQKEYGMLKRSNAGDKSSSTSLTEQQRLEAHRLHLRSKMDAIPDIIDDALLDEA